MLHLKWERGPRNPITLFEKSNVRKIKIKVSKALRPYCYPRSGFSASATSGANRQKAKGKAAGCNESSWNGILGFGEGILKHALVRMGRRQFWIDQRK